MLDANLLVNVYKFNTKLAVKLYIVKMIKLLVIILISYSVSKLKKKKQQNLKNVIAKLTSEFTFYFTN